MKLKRLMDLVEQADTHRRLLSDYDGGYSLGIGQFEGDAVLVLQVERDAPQAFPHAIRLDGESVPVLVEHSFVTPTPLSAQG